MASIESSFIFSNHSPANVKLSETQISKIIQSGGFLGKVLGPLSNIDLPVAKNVPRSLAKAVLINIGLAASTLADEGIHKKSHVSGTDDSRIFGSRSHDPRTFGSGITALKISNKEMKDIMKIDESLEDSGILLKGASKTIKNEARFQKR